MHSNAHRVPTAVLLAACVAILTACGGGGSGSADGVVSSRGTPGTPTAAATLSGVAAVSAPLLGATIKVVDGGGAAVGLLDSAGKSVASGVTNSADGTFK